MAGLKKNAKAAVLRAAKDFGLGWRIPRAYRSALGAPVDQRKVLFLEASMPDMPEAFGVMFERLAADGRFDPQFISLGKHRVGAVEYLANAEAFAREAATARAIFLCDTSDVVSSLPLRPETTVVQLWHACGAFKRWGMSTAEYRYGLGRKDILAHPFHANTSFVTVSSPDVAWAYVEAMALEDRPETVAPTGVSRTDRFFDEAFIRTSYEHLVRAVPQAAGEGSAQQQGTGAFARPRIVLYAPTFRGPIGRAQAPELPDFAMLLDALGPDSLILVKQHPMVASRPPVPAAVASRVIDVTDALAIDELIVCADALVTDYSSVVFEFSLFARPMVFFAPDLDDYLDERNFFYPYEEMAPGPVARTQEELAACLANLERSFADGGAQRVGAFRAKFMSACDGHATDRILERALGI